MREVVAIVNPNSAGGSTAKLWKRIKVELEKSVGNFSTVFTTAPNQAPELCRQALKDGAKLIIA
ncbi:MAG TPA: diacylglycerol kinase family lipid kinase, partial [Proteobacteria bacterium]|nr:diacylglycerol kinase family lipid kinase [Pseudomonadota bacterium]